MELNRVAIIKTTGTKTLQSTLAKDNIISNVSKMLKLIPFKCF